MAPTKEVVLSLAAMFTLSPNKQYCGIFSPTRPAATGPKCIPTTKKKNPIKDQTFTQGN